jgi:hypothetical protein
VLGFAVACGTPSTLPPASAPPSAASTATSAGASATPTTTAAPTAASAPILGFSLTDVRTGERFTLAGFTGKTVIVQGMAVW